MRRLYHEDIGPDGQVLGRRQRKANYPEAGGIAVQADRGRGGRPVRPSGAGSSRRRRNGRSGCRLRSAYRTVVPFYDRRSARPRACRCSGRRSWPLRPKRRPRAAKRTRSGSPSEAAQVRGAVKRANDRMIAVAGAASSLTSAPGTTRRRRASGGTRRGSSSRASRSTTRRDGDPQLHVHNAIANRAQRADESGRASGGRCTRQPLFRNKLRLGHAG